LKFTALTEEFQGAVKYTAGILDSKPLKPLFGLFMIKAHSNGVVEINVNNTSDYMRVKFPAEVTEPGETATDGKLLHSMLSNFQAPHTKWEQASNLETALIRNGKSKFKVSVWDSAEFPAVNRNPSGMTLTFFTQEIVEALEETLYAVAKQNDKPVLTCLNFTKSPDKDTVMNITASDGFRLAYKEISFVPQNATPSELSNFQVNIPGKYAKELLKILKNVDVEQVSFLYDGKRFSVDFGDIFYSTLVMNGEFPNIKSLLNTQRNKDIQMDKTEFTEKLKLASILAKSDENRVFIKISDREMKMSSKKDSDQFDTTADVIEANNIQPDSPIQLTMSYSNLSDVINAIPTEIFRAEFSDTDHLVFFYPEDNRTTHIVATIKTV
jgi:DNA polymerase-3 subunit beta